MRLATRPLVDQFTSRFLCESVLANLLGSCSPQREAISLVPAIIEQRPSECANLITIESLAILIVPMEPSNGLFYWSFQWIVPVVPIRSHRSIVRSPLIERFVWKWRRNAKIRRRKKRPFVEHKKRFRGKRFIESASSCSSLNDWRQLLRFQLVATYCPPKRLRVGRVFINFIKQFHQTIWKYFEPLGTISLEHSSSQSVDQFNWFCCQPKLSCKLHLLNWI